MNFSPEWEERYREHTHISVWPWSDLVSYVMRYASPRDHLRVLELGCGAGANIPLFIHLNSDYYGIDGSQAIVDALHPRFPALSDKIVVGDFTRELPFQGEFDLVCDRASLTHNTTSAIKDSIALVKKMLRPGGKFMGIDWFSTSHEGFAQGESAEDNYTRRAISTGPFAGVGRVHFSDKEHLMELFEGFTMDVLEHKIISRDIPAEEGYGKMATWNFTATYEG